mgnify:CR=1 FL=1
MVGFLRKGFVDAEGHWPGLYAIGYTIICNNKRVSQEERPKRYETCYNRAGKIIWSWTREDHDLLAGLIDL